VSRVYLRPDYDQVDKAKTKRLAIATQPPPEDSRQLGELWGLIARRYVNQKRNFLAKAHLVESAEKFERSRFCTDGLEGVLWLRPREVREQETKVQLGVVAQLLRCADGERIWEAEAKGTWPQNDETLRALTEQYVAELGPKVRPFAAGSFHLLKATLDRLPDPVLSDDDVSEKIELQE
jgi:probable lipoprotein (TIGR04455 family)